MDHLKPIWEIAGSVDRAYNIGAGARGPAHEALEPAGAGCNFKTPF